MDSDEPIVGMLGILILALIYFIYPPLFWAWLIFVVIISTVFCYFLFKQWDEEIAAKKADQHQPKEQPHRSGGSE